MSALRPDLLEFDQACARLQAVWGACAPSVECVPLHAALGRVLARSLHAPRNIPGFAHAAMDGYAVHHADLRVDADTSLRVAFRALAGDVRARVLTSGECAYIATGAPLPQGADTVIIAEHARLDGEYVHLRAGTASGANVRAADDDYAANTLALAAGTRLLPAHLGVAASFGCTQLEIARRPRVAILASGDELRAPGEVLEFGQRYDSNRVVIEALAQRYGLVTTHSAPVRDDADALREAMLAAAQRADVILTTGGVSVGAADFIPGLLAEHGSVLLWKVRMRPGMPVLVGRLGQAWVFALPGNPVSVMATFRLFVLPAIYAMTGADAQALAPTPARLRQALRKPVGRMDFRRANVTVDAQGVRWAEVHPSVSSGALRSMAESTSLVALDAAREHYDAGDIVAVYAWPEG